MKYDPKIFRSFTLLEMLTVVSLLGTFLLLTGPLTLHLIYAVQGRTRTYDQLFLVSQVSDKIRFDLKGSSRHWPHRVVSVEPERLLIRARNKTIEYRTADKQIERIETLGGIPRTTAVWKMPLTALTFSRQPGTPGAVLVELHWSLARAGDRLTSIGKIPLEMAFAAADDLPRPSTPEVIP